jgi:hypothetical protein
MIYFFCLTSRFAQDARLKAESGQDRKLEGKNIRKILGKEGRQDEGEGRWMIRKRSQIER